MIKKKKLPNNIQFQFDIFSDPVSIELLVNLQVYLGQTSSFENTPVLYSVCLIFLKDDEQDKYLYHAIELDACYRIDPYDEAILETKLKQRLNEILEPCTLNPRAPLKEQLEVFLSEYGGFGQARFIL